MKGKRFSQKEFLQLLSDNGYNVIRRGKGSHTIYGKGNDTISVPREINHMMALRLIKEHGLCI